MGSHAVTHRHIRVEVPNLDLSPGGGIPAVAREAFNAAAPPVKARVYLALTGLAVGQIGNTWTPADRLAVATALVVAEFDDDPLGTLARCTRDFDTALRAAPDRQKRKGD